MHASSPLLPCAVAALGFQLKKGSQSFVTSLLSHDQFEALCWNALTAAAAAAKNF